MEEYFFGDVSLGAQQLSDILEGEFAESFFIKGEPDYCLGTCLKRCPESILDLITKEYKLEAGSEKGRKRYLKQLERKIIEEMPVQLETVSAQEFELLIKLAMEKGDVEEAVVGFGLQRKGWVFYYEKQSAIPIVPYEILNRLRGLAKDPGFVTRMAYYEMLRCYISAFLNLYGVFEKKWLSDIIRKHDVPEESTTGASEDKSEEKKPGLSGETELSNEMLEEAVISLKEESEDFGMEEEYIFNSDLGDDEDYKERFNAVKDIPYYEPSMEDIMLYRDNCINKNLKEYQILKRYLSKKVDDNVKLERLLDELSIEVVEELGGIFAISEIIERYEGVFSSAGELKEFEQLFRNWEDHVRKWNNRGFTNAEMKERGENGSCVKIDWDLAKIKFKDNTPDPEAPCPCGSGKKYRQCCKRLKL